MTADHRCPSTDKPPPPPPPPTLNNNKLAAQTRSRGASVKPVSSDHPTVQGKVVVIDRWSLIQGSLKQTDFPSSVEQWTVFT